MFFPSLWNAVELKPKFFCAVAEWTDSWAIKTVSLSRSPTDRPLWCRTLLQQAEDFLFESLMSHFVTHCPVIEGVTAFFWQMRSPSHSHILKRFSSVMCLWLTGINKHDMKKLFGWDWLSFRLKGIIKVSSKTCSVSGIIQATFQPLSYFPNFRIYFCWTHKHESARTHSNPPQLIKNM